MDSLHVRAGLDGVLSAVSVEVGQQVTLGTNLVRVADPSHLKATVQIPETQAKDVAIGQKASIDTHNGIVPGHVTRIDAAVVNGMVAADVELDGVQPPGARPDLSVDGTIEIERLPDILYVGRPVQGQDNSSVGLFKVVDGGTAAVRVTVQLGRSSVNTIEVLRGLQIGDQVILSDMSVAGMLFTIAFVWIGSFGRALRKIAGICPGGCKDRNSLSPRWRRKKWLRQTGP